jgi:hypothetical protein
VLSMFPSKNEHTVGEAYQSLLPKSLDILRILLKVGLQLVVELTGKCDYYGPALLHSHVITRNYMTMVGNYK